MIEKDTNPKDAIADNKLPLWLVSPIVKAYQSIAHFLGNVKYGAWNYRAAGARASVYYSAANRHLDAWFEGEEVDPVDGTPHLANALACINILIEAKHSHNLVDDRPPGRSAELATIRRDFEALMPKIRERYKDKNPVHYSRLNSVSHGSSSGEDVTLGDYIARKQEAFNDFVERKRALAGDQL